MELLRRALLVGCVLPGLWLFRLAPLDPLLSIAPVDFAARQARERAATPEDRKTEAQRRQALLPLSVYIEELIQYNVFSAVGPAWDGFLRDIDIRAESGMAPRVFLRADSDPISAVNDKLAAAGGTTFISISRSSGDAYYQVDRHTWTRNHFLPWSGFQGTPVPPWPLLYPFRAVGVAAMMVGVVLFLLFPSRTREGSFVRITGAEAGLLTAALLCFTIPLAAVGGSVQALTRAPLLTGLCWVVTCAGMHWFAAPARHAPDPPTPARADRLLFLREGFVFLVMAFGPSAFLISASLVLWNR